MRINARKLAGYISAVEKAGTRFWIRRTH